MDPKGFMRIAKQSTVLRLLIQSAWTTHYSEIHRISSLTLVPLRPFSRSFSCSAKTDSEAW